MLRNTHLNAFIIQPVLPQFHEGNTGQANAEDQTIGNPGEPFKSYNLKLAF